MSVATASLAFRYMVDVIVTGSPVTLLHFVMTLGAMVRVAFTVLTFVVVEVVGQTHCFVLFTVFLLSSATDTSLACTAGPGVAETIVVTVVRSVTVWVKSSSTKDVILATFVAPGTVVVRV